MTVGVGENDVTVLFGQTNSRIKGGLIFRNIVFVDDLLINIDTQCLGGLQ